MYAPQAHFHRCFTIPARDLEQKLFGRDIRDVLGTFDGKLFVVRPFGEGKPERHLLHHVLIQVRETSTVFIVEGREQLYGCDHASQESRTHVGAT